MSVPGLYEAAPYSSAPRWNHGNIPRARAEQILLPSRHSNPFLVRRRDNGEFVMSLRWNASGLTHSLIRQYPNGLYQLDGVPHAFPDLQSVILDYVRAHGGRLTPVASDGSAVSLPGLNSPTSPQQPYSPPFPQTSPPPSMQTYPPPGSRYSYPPAAGHVPLPSTAHQPGTTAVYPPPSHPVSPWQVPRQQSEPTAPPLGPGDAPPPYHQLFQS